METNDFDFSRLDDQLEAVSQWGGEEFRGKYADQLQRIAYDYPVTLEKVVGFVKPFDVGGQRFIDGEGFAFFRWQGLSIPTALQATREWAQRHADTLSDERPVK